MARKRTHLQRGSTTVEFAFVAVFVLLPLLVGLFDFGRVILYFNMLSNAAREGARVGVIDSRTADEICIAAASKTWLHDTTPVTGCGTFGALTVVAKDGTQSTFNDDGERQFGDPVEVGLEYNFQPVSPYLGAIFDPDNPAAGKMRIRASASMYVED